jgi:ATP-dependent DNA helicase RecG
VSERVAVVEDDLVEAGHLRPALDRHQLRGRVGRGRGPSSCLLLYVSRASDVARERLAVNRNTEDGFAIAEADLELRGPGELLGTRQSGLPDMRVVRWEVHGDLVQSARDDAKLLLTRDPELTSPRGEAVRLLMYLFSRPEALRLVEAG